MLVITDKTVKLSSLEKKMLTALTLPMKDVCPSSLRYELAKYDSDDVKDAYKTLFDLYSRGKLVEKE